MTYLPRSLIRRKGETAVWRSRQLGARSSVTGYPVITWISGVCFDCDCFDPDCFLCDYNIKIIREHISTREETIAGNRMTRKVVAFFTWAPLHKYDQVDYHGDTFEVESVEYKLWLNGKRSFNRAVMVEVSYYGHH